MNKWPDLVIQIGTYTNLNPFWGSLEVIIEKTSSKYAENQFELAPEYLREVWEITMPCNYIHG